MRLSSFTEFVWGRERGLKDEAVILHMNAGVRGRMSLASFTEFRVWKGKGGVGEG